MESHDVQKLAVIYSLVAEMESLKAKIAGMDSNGRYTEKSYLDVSNKLTGIANTLSQLACD